MAGPDPSFQPRPWPNRPPGRTALTGRRVLVVDGDAYRAAELARALSHVGCGAQAVPDLDAAVERGRGTSWEVVVLAGEPTSAEEVGRALAIGCSPAVLVVASGPSSPGEVDALEAGAAAWLPEGSTPERVRVEMGRVLERRGLAEENRRLRERLAGREDLGGFVSHDPAMQQVLRTARAVAGTQATVLLLGESGTGKTMLARAIHRLQATAENGEAGVEAPFVVVNCGALPGSLLESELFGHAKGAFTGAVKDRPGRFEQADGGTIFLDEVNSASLDLQVKLLRVLQERRFERVGETRTREVSVRVIAASNQDLEEEIREGRFREDLYWRLNVVSLELPPLRERPGDVAHLAEHFLAHFADLYAKRVRTLAEATRARLVAYPWPGNVRQLENAMERAVLLSSGHALELGDLGEEIGGRPPEPGLLDEDSLLAGLRNLSTLPPLKIALEGPERAIILRALELNGGNRQRTADMLDVNRSTLHNKMRKYGLMERSFETP